MVYIERAIQADIEKALTWFPAVALLGPRQCGKSTLAKHIIAGKENAVYLDLQREEDRRKLEQPDLYLEEHRDSLVCLDEVQLRPTLFPVLRSLIDDYRKPGRFMILGSASRDLIQSSSESLAGRISYHELAPFMLTELPKGSTNSLWIRGGFPDSFLAPDEEMSYQWRGDFIRTFLERDLSQLGFNLPPASLRRFWRLLAHSHGTELNQSKLAGILGVTDKTVRNWIDALAGTFMIRILPPFERNLKKRLIKSPKVYIRDSGILHSLLELRDFDQLHGSLSIGESWEGWALETILAAHSDWRASFLKTSNGNEVDLVLEQGEKTVFIEFKYNPAPKVGRGFRILTEEVCPDSCWYVVPSRSAYPLDSDIQAGPPRALIKALGNMRS